MIGLVGIAMVLLSPSALRVRPAGDGDLLAWLVAGPYPNEGALERRGTGFRTDYLGGEADASPKEGEAVGGHSWKFATGTRERGIDLKKAISDTMPAIGYCFTTIESQSDLDALLLFGSDDGAKVYLNGEQVFSKQIARGVKRDEERVPIHLRKGANRLLFKVEQGDGGWGLMARIVDPQGKPGLPIVQQLEVEPGASFVRRFAGKPGSLNVEVWGTYEVLSRTTGIWLKNLRAEADHPDRLEVALGEAGKRIEAEQEDADRASRAVEEGVRAISDAYTSARVPLLKWAQNPGPQFSVEVTKEDYVKVLSGGRYFAHSDGKPFIPIGFNHNPDWPELEESNPLYARYDPDRTDRWFANIAEHGVNVVRLMVETPPTGNLEDKPGVYSPEHVRWLDAIFATARKHHVKLWVTPYDTFWMSLRADACPYWAANGGPIEKPIDFLTKPSIMQLQKSRMKYLIDRYGNTGTVFAWEVMNEIDLWWKANPAQIAAWTDEMVAFVRDYQRKRWGREHLVTISMAAAEPKDGNADTAFRRSDLDFATMHLYLGATKAPKPGDAEKAGEDFAAGVLYARSQIRDNRPVLDGESGPIDKWVADEKLDDEVFHQMSWQHLMAGGAGPGTRWPYRNPHHVTKGMLETLKAMRTFCDGVAWSNLTGPTVTVDVAGPTESHATVFATKDGAIGWLRLPKGGAERTFTLRWNGSKGRLFDVRHGEWIDGVKASGGGLKIVVPANVDEVAVFGLR